MTMFRSRICALHQARKRSPRSAGISPVAGSAAWPASVAGGGAVFPAAASGAAAVAANGSSSAAAVAVSAAVAGVFAGTGGVVLPVAGSANGSSALAAGGSVSLPGGSAKGSSAGAGAVPVAGVDCGGVAASSHGKVVSLKVSGGSGAVVRRLEPVFVRLPQLSARFLPQPRRRERFLRVRPLRPGRRGRAAVGW